LAVVIFTSILSGVHLTDAHNGYRMIRVSALGNIHITMDGMEYASEFIDQIGKINSSLLRFQSIYTMMHIRSENDRDMAVLSV